MHIPRQINRIRSDLQRNPAFPLRCRTVLIKQNVPLRCKQVFIDNPAAVIIVVACIFRTSGSQELYVNIFSVNLGSQGFPR